MIEADQIKLQFEVVVRILHVITDFDAGGAEHHLLSLASLQAGIGAQVHIAYLKGTGSLTSHLNGLSVTDLGLKRYGEIQPLLRLRGLIRKLQPDVIHAHMPPAELYCCLTLATLSFRGRLVITKHNDERFFDGFGQRFVAAQIAKRADGIIAISDAVKKFLLKEKVVIDASKVKVIHYGINPDDFRKRESRTNELRRSLGIRPESFLIGTVARLASQKNLESLLRAFSRLPDPEAQLALVGEGPLEVELKCLASSLGIQNRVYFAGKRKDIKNIMADFDLFVLPSRYEGFGLVILEAMSARVPVIASKVSAIPEIIKSGENGLLFQCDDIHTLSKLIVQIMSKPDLGLKLSNQASHAIKKHFRLDVLCEKTIQFYQQLTLAGSAKNELAALQHKN